MPANANRRREGGVERQQNMIRAVQSTGKVETRVCAAKARASNAGEAPTRP